APTPPLAPLDTSRRRPLAFLGPRLHRLVERDDLARGKDQLGDAPAFPYDHHVLAAPNRLGHTVVQPDRQARPPLPRAAAAGVIIPERLDDRQKGSAGQIRAK